MCLRGMLCTYVWTSCQLLSWALAPCTADFPTPLQSWNFKFSPKNPTSQKFKKWNRLLWRFCRRNKGEDVTEICSYTTKFDFLFIAVRSYTGTWSLQAPLHAGVPHDLFLPVECGWKWHVVFLSVGFLRGGCAFSNVLFPFHQLASKNSKALGGGRPTRCKAPESLSHRGEKGFPLTRSICTRILHKWEITFRTELLGFVSLANLVLITIGIYIICNSANNLRIPLKRFSSQSPSLAKLLVFPFAPILFQIMHSFTSFSAFPVFLPLGRQPSNLNLTLLNALLSRAILSQFLTLNCIPLLKKEVRKSTLNRTHSL